MSIPDGPPSPAGRGKDVLTETIVAVKVDVDTAEGARRGLPKLGAVLDRREVKASVYLSLGPDRSGRAVVRVLTRPGFLGKMVRTKAPSTYGLQTLLAGTLLPAPIIGRDLGPLVGDLEAAGHEIGLHAWNHVAWHDGLWRGGASMARRELAQGLNAFRALTGRNPAGFAAPAWRINAAAAAFLERAGVVYTSATRGRCPYWMEIFGHRYDLLEIPTTLPTADEVLGRGGLTPDDLPGFWLELLQPGLNVLTVHTELEGRALASSFGRFLDRAGDRGVRFEPMIDVARRLRSDPGGLPTSEVIRARLPGRSGRVSCQR
jgi:peptidoglycan/xylan/chitin deacetylase (PgdA/CDA1 family)